MRPGGVCVPSVLGGRTTRRGLGWGQRGKVFSAFSSRNVNEERGCHLTDVSWSFLPRDLLRERRRDECPRSFDRQTRVGRLGLHVWSEGVYGASRLWDLVWASRRLRRERLGIDQQVPRLALFILLCLP